MPDWQYTFVDARTSFELGTFPLTQTKMGLALSGAAPFDGYLSLLEPRIRADNPWAATRQRRTELFVEYSDDGVTDVVWCGLVWSRDRSSDSNGITLAGATHESFLAKQLPTLDAPMTGDVDAQVAWLMGMAQNTPGAMLGTGFEIVSEGVSGTSITREYSPRALKDILELLQDFSATGVPVEFRVRGYRDQAGQLRKQLVYGEPRIGRTYEESPMKFRYPGALKEWRYTEDGGDVDNVMIGAGSGSGLAQPFVQVNAADIGVDEIDSGFPATVGVLQDGQEEVPARVRARTESKMREKMAGEIVLSGLKVRSVGPPRLGTYWPGDDLGFSISHLSFPEYDHHDDGTPRSPDETRGSVEVLARLLSMTMTPNAEAGIPDVDLVVGTGY